MPADKLPETRLSLLIRAKDPNDQSAWCALDSQYREVVYRWARRWGLQHADAENVAQEIVTKLFQKIDSFDPSKARFRSWLKTITNSKLRDFAKSRRKRGEAPISDSVLEALAQFDARGELEAELEQQWERDMYVTASNLVREREDPRKWRVFEMRNLATPLPYEVIAQELKVTAAKARVWYQRTCEKIQRTVEELLGSGNNAPPE